MDQSQSPSHMDSGQPASSEGYHLLIVSPQVTEFQLLGRGTSAPL